MARRHSYRTPYDTPIRERPKKIGAFYEAQVQTIKITINKMFTHVISFNHISMTHDEACCLVTPPEYREAFKLAALYADAERDSNSMDIVWRKPEAHLSLWLNTNYKSAPFVPKTPILQQDIPDELRARITAWVERRLELGKEWGRVKLVFEQLNMVSTTPQQIRYLWPGFTVILQQAGFDNMVETMGDYKEPRAGIPPIPPSLREMTRLAMQTVAGYQLLPEEEPDLDMLEVSAGLYEIPAVSELGYSYPML